jgi:hypothetical protein
MTSADDGGEIIDVSLNLFADWFLIKQSPTHTCMQVIIARPLFEPMHSDDKEPFGDASRFELRAFVPLAYVIGEF